MIIVATNIEKLNKIEVINNLVHLTAGGKLYTEKVNPANNTEPAWVNGKASFKIETAKGWVEVLSTASEWKATRTTAASFVQKSVQLINNVKISLGCGTCGS